MPRQSNVHRGVEDNNERNNEGRHPVEPGRHPNGEEVARQTRAPARMKHDETIVTTSSTVPLKRRERGKSSLRRSSLLSAGECSDDIERLCTRSQKVDNFVIIDCLEVNIAEIPVCQFDKMHC